MTPSSAAPSILFDARLVLKKPTGIGQYVASLLPEIARVVPDLEIRVLHHPTPWPGYGLLDLVAPNIVLEPMSLRHMSLRQQIEIPRHARRRSCCLIHYPHFDAPVGFGRVPVVATLHDAKYLVRPDFFPSLGRAKRVWMRHCFSRTLRKAAAVVTDSNATAMDLQTLFGTPPEQLDVVPLGVDPRFHPAAPEEIQAFRRNQNITRPYVISVGERRPHKNHVGLIRAWARCAARETHDLVIVGQRYADYSAPEEAVAAAGLGDCVRFLTDVSAEELPAAYSGASVFALVSHFEGFGLPILEAMACGVPVVASATTATGETLGDGGIGVDPINEAQIASAIGGLLASREERERWRQRGQGRSRQFRWQDTAERTAAVWRRVLAQREAAQ